MSKSPIAIIGAGLAGAATAWSLARRGLPVVLLERSSPANPLGSSHGSARIFRYTYPDPFYTGLVAQARRGWDELEAATGATLISRVGALDYGALRNPGGLADVLTQHGICHELLSAAEATSRWPGISFSSDVLWHADAGVIDSQSAVTAMVDLAVAAGAQLHTDWVAARIVRDGSTYVVESESGDAIAVSQVVVAAGGWLPALLDRLDLPAEVTGRLPALQVRQEQALHFSYRDPDAVWPTIINKRYDIQVYALPGGRDAGFRGQKVAEYNVGRILDSALDHDRVIDPDNRRRVVEYVTHALPGLHPEPYAETTCLFTNVPGDDFIIDRIEGITILSPCSGHGAKFAPLVGDLAARLVTGENEGIPRFRPLMSAATA